MRLTSHAEGPSLCLRFLLVIPKWLDLARGFVEELGDGISSKSFMLKTSLWDSHDGPKECTGSAVGGQSSSSRALAMEMRYTSGGYVDAVVPRS